MNNPLMLSLEANLAVPICEAFEYATQKEHLPHWLHPDEIQLAGYYWEGKLDSEYLLVFEDAQGEQYRIVGIIQEVEKQQHIGFSWVLIDEDDEPKHRMQYVNIIFEDFGDGTKLHLSHMGFETEEALEHHKISWEQCLKNLENYIVEK